METLLQLPRAPESSWQKLGEVQTQPQDLSSGRWQKAPRLGTQVEPVRQSPSTFCGMASKACVSLVTAEPATRRVGLESKGKIRKKQETRGGREPSITGQLGTVQPAVGGRDRSACPSRKG